MRQELGSTEKTCGEGTPREFEEKGDRWSRKEETGTNSPERGLQKKEGKLRRIPNLGSTTEPKEGDFKGGGSRVVLGEEGF